MLYGNIDGMISEAMKEQNHTKLEVLRAIKNEFLIKEKEKDFKGINDVTEAKILQKMVTQREDSIEQYKKGNRNDLAEAEQKEADIIKEYMPKMPTEEDIVAETEKVIASLGDDHVLSMKDMKPIMAEVQKTYPMANGKVILSVIRKYI